jgi:LysM repeat protein
VLAALLTLGCGDGGNRGPGIPFYQRGRKLVLNKEFPEGREAFERCLRRQPDFAPAHLELGMLCEEQFQDYGNASLHYREFLRLVPDDPQREVVERWIARSEIALLRELAERYPGTVAGQETARLRAERDDLARRLSDAAVLFREAEATRVALQEQLAKAEKARLDALQESVSATVERASSPAPAPSAPIAPPPPKTAAPAPPEREHLVVNGDTLAAISREYYGSVRYWPQLQEYNRDVLHGGTRLIIGQRLRIPPVTELPGAKEKGDD